MICNIGPKFVIPNRSRELGGSMDGDKYMYEEHYKKTKKTPVTPCVGEIK